MAQSHKLPSRLHHTAYVTHDLEATRKFYEDVIGMPLVATWCEVDELFGESAPIATSFSAWATAARSPSSSSPTPRTRSYSVRRCRASPFHHIALDVDAETQDAIEKRIAAAGNKPPDTYVLEHGYCRSVYVTDPNGLILEFTLDHPEAENISRDRRADAHRELKRWLEGNHESNNTYR